MKDKLEHVGTCEQGIPKHHLELEHEVVSISEVVIETYETSILLTRLKDGQNLENLRRILENSSIEQNEMEIGRNTENTPPVTKS